MVTSVNEEAEAALVADLDQFSTFDRKGGWALAYLVARRVEPDKGTGVTIEQQSKWCEGSAWRRISAREFARRTGTSHKRVMAYLHGWNRAAADNVVPLASALDHDATVHLPDEDEIPFFGTGGYYHGHEAYHISEQRLERIEKEAELAGVTPNTIAYVTTHPKAVTAAILADEKLFKAAEKAFAEHERRQQEADRADREASERLLAEQLLDDCEEAVIVQATPDTAADSSKSPLQEGEIEVLQELTAAHLGVMRTLALLKKHAIVLTPEHSAAIADLCNITRAALDTVHDLATSNNADLSDAALQAFLEESEKQ